MRLQVISLMCSVHGRSNLQDETHCKAASAELSFGGQHVRKFA